MNPIILAMWLRWWMPGLVTRAGANADLCESGM